MLGLAQVFAGRPDSAVRTLERGLRLHPDAPGMNSTLLFAYASAGRWADAERIRSQLRGSDHSGGIEADFAELVFGNREPLVRRLLTDAGQLEWIDFQGFAGCHPFLDPLWSDERFREAMRTRMTNACPLVGPWPIPPRRSS